jgi:hypothetical protein
VVACERARQVEVIYSIDIQIRECCMIEVVFTNQACLIRFLCFLFRPRSWICDV